MAEQLLRVINTALTSIAYTSAGFFGVFTAALLVTHILILTNNMSTVEQMGMRRMREREDRVLARLYSWWQIRYVFCVLLSGLANGPLTHSRVAMHVYREKRMMKGQWDAVWGRIGKEGHMWWLGSARKNWESTMGDRFWMWFCEYRLATLSLAFASLPPSTDDLACMNGVVPIGKSPDDGLSYVVNPRFDKEGRWLPRSEWPAALR